MSEEKDLEELKKEAAEKAKAAAAAKSKAVEQSGAGAPESEGADELAKKKAAAVAKAKAAAAAKRKAMEQSGAGAPESEGADELAKKKAAAVAKAKAAAAAKRKAVGDASGEKEPSSESKPPSPNELYLNKYITIIKEHLGEDVLEESYLNILSKDVPTLVARRDAYYRIAQFLKYNEFLSFDYLSELHGTDYQTHMEIYVHLYSYKNRQSLALKVKVERHNPEIESVQPLWAGAEWPECEAYDLLGIQFKGHPNLHRIMLGEEWVGHPLRKDYEPYDVEV